MLSVGEEVRGAIRGAMNCDDERAVGLLKSVCGVTGKKCQSCYDGIVGKLYFERLHPFSGLADQRKGTKGNLVSFSIWKDRNDLFIRFQTTGATQFEARLRYARMALGKDGFCPSNPDIVEEPPERGRMLYLCITLIARAVSKGNSSPFCLYETSTYQSAPYMCV